MAEFPETDLYNKVLNLGLPTESIIVVGSKAIEAVVGPDVRRGQDTDIAVTEEVYGHLRERHDLEETIYPDGYRRLQYGDVDISVGWSGKSVQELQGNGYMNQGVPMAGWTDVYEYKEKRGLPKDNPDLEIMRQRLYGPTPLPAPMVKGELDFVRSCLPEHL
ncbi:MAG TPA: hypothetical protein VMR45_03340, partial [Patescibacteria group bacterium]|nr:hypothetical protein [Patescibacteria group bacterium]